MLGSNERTLDVIGSSGKSEVYFYAYRLQTIFDSNYSAVLADSLRARYQPEGDFSSKEKAAGILIYKPYDIYTRSGGPKINKSISYDETFEKVKNIAKMTADSHPTYFSTSIREEIDRGNAPTITALRNLYETRLESIFDKVNERYGGALDSWQEFSGDGLFRHSKKYAQQKTYALERTKSRLNWICDSIFDDAANNQRRYLSNAHYIPEESLCDKDQKEGEDMIDYVDQFIDSAFTPASKFSDFSHENRGTFFISYPTLVASTMLLSLPIPDRTDSREWATTTLYADFHEGLRELVSLAVASIAIDAKYAAYYGYEPPIPFDFYRRELASALSEVLLDEVKGMTDIEDRLVRTGMTSSELSFVRKVFYSDNLSQREKKILEAYQNILNSSDREILQRQKEYEEEQNARELARQEENKYASEKRIYLDSYFHIATVEACYSARKNYLVPYILEDQIESARRAWQVIDSNSTLPEKLKKQVETDLKAGETFQFFIQAYSAPQYHVGTAQQCGLSLNALTL